MDDGDILDWIEMHDADISCLREGPEGPCHQPWNVTIFGQPDGRGKTIRSAVEDSRRKRAALWESLGSKGQKLTNPKGN
jgi:hypothetical protein